VSKKLVFNFSLVNDNFDGHQPKMAMIIDKGLISWIGPQNKIPKKIKFKSKLDLKKKKIFPAFIECHTHSVFAGSRADEFEMRNTGVSYLEIAKKGGGILSTMKKTRAASVNELLATTQERVNNFLKQGVATVEIKSGYALDLKNEIKTLEVIRKIKKARVVPTFLGAHAKPPEYESYGAYLDYLADEVLPVVKKKKLASRVDIFIEKNFFETSEARKYLSVAKRLGFEVTIHANQLSLSGGAELALEIGAQSADHVIHLTDETIEYFARNQTVAVLLPAADLYMKCPYPPARRLIDSGATVALATDYNPGTCPTQDISLVGLLARLEMKMTLPEVFQAYTINAAKALGIDQEEGSLKVGKRANFISTEAELADFFYSAGSMPKHELFILGNRTLVG
jgi:imidazolonepropionase